MHAKTNGNRTATPPTSDLVVARLAARAHINEFVAESITADDIKTSLKAVVVNARNGDVAAADLIFRLYSDTVDLMAFDAVSRIAPTT